MFRQVAIVLVLLISVFFAYNAMALTNSEGANSGVTDLLFSGISGESPGYDGATIFAQNDPVNITAQNPPSGSNVSGPNPFLGFNFTGDLSNCSLYGNWSGAWAEENSTYKNISQGQYNFVLNGSEYNCSEVYLWNVYCVDADNDTNDDWGNNYTFTYDCTGGPVINLAVNLKSPQEGASFNQSDVVSFEFNLTSDDNAPAMSYNCSLWWNETGQWQEENQVIVVQANASIVGNGTINETVGANGTIIWNVKCKDSATGNPSNMSSVNRTIQVNSTMPPSQNLSVTLQAPPDDPSYCVDNKTNLDYNLNGPPEDFNCTLLINDTLYSYDNVSLGGHKFYLNESVLSNGLYNWSVNCSSFSSSEQNQSEYRRFNFTNMTCGGFGPKDNSNYTYLWSNAQPANNFTNASNLFDFSGAPYVARGPGCKLAFDAYDNASIGQNCCNDGNCPNGNPALDLGAVWVDQASGYLAWHIVGPGLSNDTLSYCTGNSTNVSFVFEFDSDDNKSTGCDNSAGEGCYPGADYQIWYFPDDHTSLFAYYNGSAPSADGRPGGMWNCSSNPGGVCYVENTTVNVSVYINCNPDYSAEYFKQIEEGVTVIIPKSALPEPIKINFETNSFNVTQATANPIDQLTDNGEDKFLVMGPGMDAGACYQWDSFHGGNESACVNNTENLKCVWSQVGEDGLCDPDFSKFEQGTACFTYDNTNQSACEGSELGICKWMPGAKTPDGPQNLCVEEFKPFEISGGGDCDSDCFSCMTQTQCENSNANGGSTYGGCEWYNDSFNPDGWCDIKGLKFGCSQDPKDCFDNSSCTNSGWYWNDTFMICLKSENSENCFNGIDDDGDGQADCADYDCEDMKFCGAGLDMVTGDLAGLSPEQAVKSALEGGMGGVIRLKEDNQNDAPNSNVEILGMGIAVGPKALGLGIIMENLTDLKACGGGVSDRKFMYLIDGDTNESTGCNVTINGTTKSGFGYLIKYGNYTVENQTGQVKLLYACYSGNWIMKDAALEAVTAGPESPIECGDPMLNWQNVPTVMVERASIGNPKNDIRMSVLVVNGSWDNLSNIEAYDTLFDVYYTPGTIDFEPVDCFSEPTKCGSEFIVIGQGKFMPFEDCIMPGDEDLDGLVNCADPDCVDKPYCENDPNKFDPANDKTAPRTTMSKVETFEDAAFVVWTTDEPTNGTLQLYGTNSSCQNLNYTYVDMGKPGTFDDFKPWHNAPLDQFTLGYNLSSNTTYYYKLKNYDKAGNLGQSKCLNFTTLSQPKNVSVKFDFTPPTQTPTDFLGNLSIEINGEEKGIGSAFQEGDMTNANITIENPSADPGKNWSIELIGADIFQATDINFSDKFLGNDTGEHGDIIGMPNLGWTEIVQNMGVDYVIIKIPNNGNRLYHCQDNGTSCIDVTNKEGVSLIEQGNGWTKWEIPANLGFSVYSAGGENYSLTYSLLSPGSQNALINETKVFSLNLTNDDNVSREYNFSLNISDETNTSYSLSASQYNFTSGESYIVNISINASGVGEYYFNLSSILSTNGTIILNSYDDIGIMTLNVTEFTALNTTLLQPAENSTVTTSNFTLNYSTNLLSNCTTYVWNSTNDLYSSGNALANGVGTFDMNGVDNGNYSWNVHCFEVANATNTDWGELSYNWSFAVNASSPPGQNPAINVTLLYPTNGLYLNISSFDINYTVNVDSNCTLYTNESGSWAPHNSMTANNGTNSFPPSGGYSNGDYLWNVHCVDLSNGTNQNWSDANWTFTVNSTGGPSQGVSMDVHKYYQGGPIYINDTIAFTIMVVNQGGENITEINITDSYNESCINFTVASVLPTNATNGQVIWENINGTPIAPGENITLYANFTALSECINTTNYAYVNATNGTAIATGNSSTNISIAPSGPPGGGNAWNDGLDEWRSSVVSPYVVVGTEKTLNFSLYRQAGDGSCVKNVSIIIPENYTFTGYNASSAGSANYTFSNTSSVVMWNATDNNTLFCGNGPGYFAFNVTSVDTFKSSNFQVSEISDDNNASEINLSVFTTTTFSYNGTIVDVDGQPIEGAVASLVVRSMSMDGSVTIGTFTANSSVDGSFNITDVPGLNASISEEEMGPGGDMEGLFYRLSAVKYNDSQNRFGMYVGTSMPDLPEGQLRSPMGLDNPVIYLKPAVTFQVFVMGYDYQSGPNNESMCNETGCPDEAFNYTAIEFGYGLNDQSLGYPVAEDYETLGTQVFISAPRDRNYSLMVYPMSSFPIYVNFNDIESTCTGDGNFSSAGVNATCILQNGTYFINSTISAESDIKEFNGTVNMTGLDDFSIVPYMLGSGSMMFSRDILPFNLGNMIIWPKNSSYDDQYNFTTGEYLIRLPATQTHSDIMLVAYAKKNGTYYSDMYKLQSEGLTFLNGSTHNFNMSEMISYTNYSIYSYNVTADWQQAMIANTTAMQFNLVDTNGTLLSSENAFIEMDMTTNSIEYYRMLDAANGVFYLPIVQGQGIDKLTIYSKSYSPVKMPVSASILAGTDNNTKISCGGGLCNITLKSFEMFDPDDPNATLNMSVDFIKSNSTCDVPNPGPECYIASDMGDEEFSPLKAILMGDISLRIGTGNLSVHYVHTDLLASGPPDVAFTQNSSGSVFDAAWKFGSTGPEIYDQVLIKVPYEPELNNSEINVTIPILYDVEFNVFWNQSAGNTTGELAGTDYSDYLNSPYEAYLNGTGVVCNESDSSLSSGLCYKDTVNTVLWIKIPHFSGVGPRVTGEGSSVGNLTFNVSKSADSSEYDIGDIIEYTINITNYDTENITIVDINDTYAASFMQYNASSIANTSSGINWLFWSDVTNSSVIEPGQSFILYLNMTAVSYGDGVSNFVWVNATGESGNNSIANATVLVNITDVTNPVVYLNYPANGQALTATNNVTFNVTATDNIDLDNCTLWTNISGAWAANDTKTFSGTSDYNDTWTFTALSNGTYIWNALCFDNSSNSAWNATNYTFSVAYSAPDNTYPQLSTPTENTTDGIAYGQRTYAFGMTVTDNVALHTVLIDWNGTNVTVTINSSDVFTFTINNLAAGYYAYRWYANDTSGNLNASSEYNFTVSQSDNNVVLYINGQSSNVSVNYGTSVTVNGTSDSGIYTIYKDGANISAGETWMPGAGTYTYAINSTGNANYSINSSGMAYTLEVNRTYSNVTLTLNGQDSNITVATDVAVNMTAYRLRGEGNIKLYLDNVLINDGNAWLTNTTSYSAEGIHNVTVYYDQTANYTASSETHYIIVSDLIAPTVTLNSPASNSWWNTESITFNYTVSDNNGLENCSLYYDGYRVNSTTTLNNGTYNYFTFLGNDGTHTWYVACYDNSTAKNYARANSTTLRVDYRSPETTLVGPANGTNRTTGTNITLVASDNGDSGVAYIQFYNDSWNNYTSPIAVSSEGITSISYRAVDNAGNTETAKSWTVRIDSTAPNITISNPSNLSNVSGTVDFNVTSADASFVSFAINGIDVDTDETPPFSYELNTELYSDGYLVLSTTAYDSLGNSNSTYVTIYNDNTAPSSTIAYPSSNLLTNSSVDINITATDAYAGVSYVEVYNGTGWENATQTGSIWNYTFAPSSDGVYNIKSRATDSLGNTEVAGYGVNIIYDTTAPTISSISANPNPVLNDTSYNVTVEVIDVNGLYSLSINGTSQTLTNSTVYSQEFTSAVSDGLYNVTIVAVDNAGNAVSDSTYQIEVNTTKPIITMNRANASVFANGTLVTATVANADYSYYYTSENATHIEITGSAQINASGASPFIVYVWANSSAGLNITGNYTYILDSTSPAITMNPVTTPTTTATQNISGWVTETNLRSVTINGNPVTVDTNGNFSKVVSLSQGNNTFTILATDKAGNTDTETVTINLDTLTPVTNHTLTGTLGENGWYTSNVLVTFNAYDHGALSSGYYTQYNNGSGWTNASSGSIELSQTTTLLYRTIDNAGNIEQNRTTGQIKIDKSAPSVSSIRLSRAIPAVNKSLVLRVNLTDTGSGLKPSAYQLIEIDGENHSLVRESGSTYKYEFVPSVAAVKHATIYSFDNAGNLNATSTKRFEVVVQREEKDFKFMNTSNNERNYTSEVDTSLQVTVNQSSIVGNISIAKFTDDPDFTQENLTNAVKFIEVNVSTNVIGALQWVILKVYYDDSEIAGLNESSLGMSWYNTSSGEWTTLVAGTPSWVNEVGVNETANYVWANVSHLSTYGLSGEEPVTPTTPTTSTGSSASGGSAVPAGATYKTYTASLEGGFRQKMNENDRVKFEFNARNYTLTLKSLGNGNVTMRLSVLDVNLDVVLGEPLYFDIDNDGTPDITLEASEITESSAVISLSAYEPPQEPAQEPIIEEPKENETVNTKPSETLNKSNTVNTPEPEEPSGFSPVWVWLSILIIAVIAVAVFLIFKNKNDTFAYRERKKKQHKLFSF